MFWIHEILIGMCRYYIMAAFYHNTLLQEQTVNSLIRHAFIVIADVMIVYWF